MQPNYSRTILFQDPSILKPTPGNPRTHSRQANSADR